MPDTVKFSAPRPARILAVDDSPDALDLLRRHCQSAGHQVQTARDVDEALRLLHESPVDLVITDMKMPRLSGLDLIRHLRENRRDVGIIMITGYPSVDSAVEAVKLGADEYLAKPFTRQELMTVVEQVLTTVRRRVLLTVRTEQPEGVAAGMRGIVGESSAMQAVFEAIAKAAAVRATVLITGESGTGKELVARAIHYRSPRAAHPFVPVNCGGIPESLLESELFGHVKGAFTGANETRAGFFQTADRGTIFLDEVSETSVAMQVKLLRVLQEREVCLVGSARVQAIDVRIIAGTNKDLPALIRANRFRQDLYYRLNVIAIDLPPLRQRGDDVLLLLNHFTRRYAEEMGRTPPQFSDRALKLLMSYPWPGNVRELENLAQRLLAMVDGPLIDASDLPANMRSTGFAERGAGPHKTLADVEADYIRHILHELGGNRSRAASLLGIDRKTLREKVKRYGIGGDDGE